MSQNDLMVFYKIRNKNTGEFAKAGTGLGHYRWSKKGKVFSLTALKLHLRQFNPNRDDYPYKDDTAEIVEYVMREEEANTIVPSQFT